MDNTEVTFKRLFFAVMLDDSLKETLMKLIHSLKKLSANRSIHWTRPNNLHLTLHFIGNTPLDKIPQLLRNVRQNIALFPSFQLNFSHLHLFPPSSHPHALALSIVPSMPLTELVAKVRQGVIDTQLTGNKKPYIPHITLGKFKQLPNLKTRQQQIKFPPLFVEQIALVQSQSTVKGVEYHTLEVLKLK